MLSLSVPPMRLLSMGRLLLKILPKMTRLWPSRRQAYREISYLFFPNTLALNLKPRASLPWTTSWKHIS